MSGRSKLESKLHQAEKDRNIGDVVKTLSIQDKKKALLIAVRNRLYDVMIYLLDYGVDVDYVDGYRNNLLYILLLNYDRYINTCTPDLVMQCVVKLVDSGVDVNHLNKDKETPIHIAARQGLYDVVIYLLEHGVDVQYVDSYQNNLLYILLLYYNRYINTGTPDLLFECVVKLVDAGVDVNQVKYDKDTPLYTAASRELYEVVTYLLEHGVDIHYVDSLERSILHYVLGFMYSHVEFEEKYIQLVKTLINAGFDVNQPDCKGNTPLFYVGIYDDSDDNNKTHTYGKQLLVYFGDVS